MISNPQDDLLDEYIISRDKLRREHGPHAQMMQQKFNVEFEPGYIYESDVPTAVLQKSSDAAANNQLSEEELIDVSTENGAIWANASKRIFDKFITGTRAASEYQRIGFNYVKTPKTDTDFARWGVEFLGQFNYNLPRMGYDAARLQKMDQSTAEDFYTLMTMYDQLPNFTWNGTKRLFNGFTSDPTTVAGLSTFGLAFLGRSGAKQGTKEGLKAVLKRQINNPVIVGALEGGMFSAYDNIQRQRVGIAAGKQEGIDPIEAGVATGAGLALGAAAPKVIDAAGTVAKAVGEALSQPGEMPTVGAMGGNIGDEIEKAKKLFDQALIRRESTTGRYVGGPPGLDTPQKLASLRKKVEGLTREGAPGRFWYERSGKAILKAVGGDKVEAEKIAQAIAITSSGTPVGSNFDYALQAYLQNKAGQPITTGRFPAAMSKRLTDMFNGTPWEGRKTNSFYVNLMREIDPTLEQPVTVDLWMLRAFGYGTDNPTDQQYTFVENEVNRLADQLGWEPQQVQAAIWVKAKADDEGITVDQAKFDYADALEKNKLQISWESIPGRTSGHMLEMFDAPYEVQQQYHVDISKAFLDDNGNDIIAQRLGIPTPGDFEAPGYFEGKVSPGTQTELAVPRKYKGPNYGAVDPASLQLVNAYAAVRGILMKQDGVGFHRPFYNSTKKDANGVFLDIGRSFTERETARLGEIMAELSGHSDYNPIAAPGGVRIINFSFARKNADGTKAMEDTWFAEELLKTNVEFHTLVKQALEKLDLDDDVGVRFGTFNAQEGYAGNDWSVNKNGEDYLRGALVEGSPDIQRKVRDIITELAPRIDAIDTDYQINHGFTANPEINEEFRRQVNSSEATEEVAKDIKNE